MYNYGQKLQTIHMKTHFIAIGGSAMHNLALALHNKGYQVTGSDDAILSLQSLD
jgi:UDP-N-acetylmuramate-alanine ligase